MAVKVFISYSYRDDELREQLEEHLAQLQRDGLVEAWTDRKIPPGDDWGTAIDEALETAEIVLLLVSSAFLAARYCNDVELERALTRHAAKAARVVPVIVRPCDWKSAAFAQLQALPQDGKPVTQWENRDEAWVDVVRGIREQVTQASAEAIDTPTATGPSVFVAAVTADLERQRCKLVEQLEGRRLTVREAPRAPNRAEHARAAGELLRGSDLAVHLLGPYPERAAFDDGPESLPLLDLDLGLGHAETQLVVSDEELVIEDVEEAHYAALLKRLERAERAGLERMSSRKNAMPDLVLERVDELLAARQAALANAAEAAAFIDVHTPDLGHVSNLLQHLDARQVRPLPLESADLTPVAEMEWFEEGLRQARVCFVVFGAVERQRVVARLVEANKLIWANELSTRLVGYLAPPVKQGGETMFANLSVVDASRGFDGAAVDRVLEGL